MIPLQGVVADDLTGGMETASMYVASGVACGFVTRPDLVSEALGHPVIVVAQKTRVAPPADAVARSRAAAGALLEHGARQLFFKYCATFDSTDDGNIGPVADALLDMTGATRTIFCPSAPEVARTVYNGHLFVGRQLVSESPKRHDPLTPMTDPDLVRVLQRQSPRQVGFLPHRQVRDGGAVLAAHADGLAAEGVAHMIADAIHEDDLAALAALTLDWPLVTGNSPIVRHFAALWRRAGRLDAAPPRESLPAVNGPAVVLAGSCAERTLDQLDHFARARPVHVVDLMQAGAATDAAGRAIDWARQRLDDGPVAIATSAPPDRVAAIQQRLGREGAARLAEDILGTVAAELRRASVRRFLVAGGETSGTVVDSLGITRLRVGPYEGPGVSRATSIEAEAVAFCLKSGKLGPVDMFLPTLDAMTRTEA